MYFTIEGVRANFATIAPLPTVYGFHGLAFSAPHPFGRAWKSPRCTPFSTLALGQGFGSRRLARCAPQRFLASWLHEGRGLAAGARLDLEKHARFFMFGTFTRWLILKAKAGVLSTIALCHVLKNEAHFSIMILILMTICAITSAQKLLDEVFLDESFPIEVARLDLQGIEARSLTRLAPTSAHSRCLLGTF